MQASVRSLDTSLTRHGHVTDTSPTRHRHVTGTSLTRHVHAPRYDAALDGPPPRANRIHGAARPAAHTLSHSDLVSLRQPCLTPTTLSHSDNQSSSGKMHTGCNSCQSEMMPPTIWARNLCEEITGELMIEVGQCMGRTTGSRRPCGWPRTHESSALGARGSCCSTLPRLPWHSCG